MRDVLLNVLIAVVARACRSGVANKLVDQLVKDLVDGLFNVVLTEYGVSDTELRGADQPSGIKAASAESCTSVAEQLNDGCRNTTFKRTRPNHREVLNQFATDNLLKQQYIFVSDDDKELYLLHVLRMLAGLTTIVFTKKRETLLHLEHLLHQLNFSVQPLCAKFPQKRRNVSLRNFSAGECSILIATDLGCHGLKIPTVDVVISYDLPAKTKNYMHRVSFPVRGRHAGLAVALVTPDDVVRYLQIQQRLGQKLEEFPRPNDVELLQADDEIAHALFRSNFNAALVKISGEMRREESLKFDRIKGNVKLALKKPPDTDLDALFSRLETQLKRRKLESLQRDMNLEFQGESVEKDLNQTEKKDPLRSLTGLVRNGMNVEEEMRKAFIVQRVPSKALDESKVALEESEEGEFEDRTVFQARRRRKTLTGLELVDEEDMIDTEGLMKQMKREKQEALARRMRLETVKALEAKGKGKGKLRESLKRMSGRARYFHMKKWR